MRGKSWRGKQQRDADVQVLRVEMPVLRSVAGWRYQRVVQGTGRGMYIWARYCSIGELRRDQDASVGGSLNDNKERKR